MCTKSVSPQVNQSFCLGLIREAPHLLSFCAASDARLISVDVFFSQLNLPDCAFLRERGQVVRMSKYLNDNQNV
jgi:hypothetical protein